MMATGMERSGSAEDGWGWGVPQQAQQAMPSVEWPEQEWWLTFRCDSNHMMRVAQGIWEPRGPPASRRLLELCAVALYRLELYRPVIALFLFYCLPIGNPTSRSAPRRCHYGRPIDPATDTVF
eukprot:SAG31_NODE_3682_length_3992_cov_2.502954_1_plen_123_part_00